MLCTHTTVYVNDAHRNNALSNNPFSSVMGNGYEVEANFFFAFSLFFLFVSTVSIYSGIAFSMRENNIKRIIQIDATLLPAFLQVVMNFLDRLNI